jgi:phosphoribosyl-ATP pyrophosphohydrolase/phosphoribosyl-AMP cyclohydrolase/histidinol dehydrogenase
MAQPLLRTIAPEDIPPPSARQAVAPDALATARDIIDDVRLRGEVALREQAERLGDIEPGGQLFFSRDELQAMVKGFPSDQLALLQRCADRIRRFAEAQRASLQEMTIDVPGGQAGQVVAPVDRAGCYAPGGRFPLPSSVLMTAVTARAAGVEQVWVASPRPAPVTVAAAVVAGADGLLAAGGAQAIAALAYGAGPLPGCDAVVGPGNRFVTAAKQLVAGQVAIDMLAGPSELVVFADDTADAATVAADLLAQAEHDPDALPLLVTTSAALVERVNHVLPEQLQTLSTAATAGAALKQGFAVVVKDIDQGVALCDLLAPEHLELHLREPEPVFRRCRHYGAAFVGERAAEVLGDYAAGPNHTLPTGGTARYTGGLSVFNFLRIRTWLAVDDNEGTRELASDAEALARLEGLEGHALSACRRR